jgi:hypothetical protein
MLSTGWKPKPITIEDINQRGIDSNVARHFVRLWLDATAIATQEAIVGLKVIRAIAEEHPDIVEDVAAKLGVLEIVRRCERPSISSPLPSTPEGECGK